MRRTFEQFLAVFNSLAPSQRITFAAITVLIPVGFLFFAWNGSSSSMVALSYGKVFSLDEMRNAEQALKEAGLTKFRSEGRQILAPANEVEKYNATLLQSGSLPSHWAEELEKKLDGTNPFMSSAENLKQTREALLGKHLVRMILGSPDFEDADVLWTPLSTSHSRFSKDARMKATIVVRPRPGHEMTSRQIQALRDAVTFAIPDLKATDVTVYDQRKGEAYTPDSENDPLGGKTLALLRESSQLYERRLKDALVHISPDIVVTVNVDIDPTQRSITETRRYDPKKSIEQQQTEQKKMEKFRQAPAQAEPGVKSNMPRSLASSPGNVQDRTLSDESTTTVRTPGGEAVYTEAIPALPKVVTVSVLIPEDYYTKALELEKANQGQSKTGGGKTIEKIKEETEQAVKNIVAGAIPVDPANPNPKQITVSSYVRIKEAAPEIRTSTLDTLTTLMSQWGSAVGLGLFALWALWMLRGTMPKTAKPEAPATPQSAATAAAPTPGAPGAPSQAAAAEAEKPPMEMEPMATLNDRDIVQTMVRENPEMAVAIIGKWLQAAR
jgi:flagellar M-ring protein FliF